MSPNDAVDGSSTGTVSAMEGRREFEKFLSRMGRLEAEENEEVVDE